MKPSSVFVMFTSILFLLAACSVFYEDGPRPLMGAYLALAAANFSFGLL